MLRYLQGPLTIIFDSLLQRAMTMYLVSLYHPTTRWAPGTSATIHLVVSIIQLPTPLLPSFAPAFHLHPPPTWPPAAVHISTRQPPPAFASNRTVCELCSSRVALAGHLHMARRFNSPGLINATSPNKHRSSRLIPSYFDSLHCPDITGTLPSQRQLPSHPEPRTRTLHIRPRSLSSKS